jgi:hypothetical protein
MKYYREEIKHLAIACRPCPECGRLVAWRLGIMDRHTEDGRGNACPSAQQRKAPELVRL